MKNKLLYSLVKNGDSIVTLDNDESIGCTVDFNNKYIKAFKKPFVTDFRSTILVFSWTDNAYRALNPNTIKSITPLSKVLRNGEREGKQSEQ